MTECCRNDWLQISRMLRLVENVQIPCTLVVTRPNVYRRSKLSKSRPALVSLQFNVEIYTVACEGTNDRKYSGPMRCDQN